MTEIVSGPIPMKAVVTLSGGLDSTTLAYFLKHNGFEIYPISFNYGQRHKRELDYAILTAEALTDNEWRVVELDFVRSLFAESGSSLITGEDVPEGHYAADTMSATVVPNRNMIMTSIAIGYAVSIEADRVSTAVHAGDHFIYPDCRPEFFAALNEAARAGNRGFVHPMFGIDTPFIGWTKNDIAAKAVELGVPIEDTWSCYKGGKIHCGKCGTCVERLEALNSEEVKHIDPNFVDPTQYEDSEYWKTVLT
jgi:7-cyano-7-deazaguanine synthase